MDAANWALGWWHDFSSQTDPSSPALSLCLMGSYPKFMWLRRENDMKRDEPVHAAKFRPHSFQVRHHMYTLKELVLSKEYN